MTRSARRLLAAGALAVALAAAGCSPTANPGVATAPPAVAPSSAPQATAVASAPSASGPAEIATASAAPTAGAVAYAECMRSHGVPGFPDPGAGGTIAKLSPQQLGVSDAQDQAAESACQALLPVNVGSARPTPDVAQALRFAQCMRANGEPNFPDPAGDGRIPDPATVGIDQGAPAFQTANAACEQFRPPYMPSNAQYNAWASAEP